MEAASVPAAAAPPGRRRKRGLSERRLATLRELQSIAGDRDKLRGFLRRSSMLEGLARSTALA